MPTSTNLGIDLVEVAQSDKEGSINTAIDTLDTSLAGRFLFNIVTDADYTVPEADKVNMAIEISDTGVVLTAARNIILPDNKQLHVAINNTAQTLTFKTALGTGVDVGTTAIELIYCDGTNVIAISSISATGIPYDIMQYYPGLLAVNAKLGSVTIPRTVEFLTDMVGSYAKSYISATASTVLDVKKNGGSIGSITFAAAASIGTFSITNTTFSAGDILLIEAPGTQDATLADVYITLVGYKYI